MIQAELFPLAPPSAPAMRMTAVFGGPDNCYRYELVRLWDDALPSLVVCMLNPSTGDHQRNDPTILALIHFARAWGYGGLLIVNLYAFRASQPSVMWAAEDRVGPMNGRHLQDAILYAGAHGGKLLAAWGTEAAWAGRNEWFASRATSQGVTLLCLGKTADGHPKHPMARGRHRIPRDQQPVIWRRAA